MDEILAIAERNLQALRANRYPGRGILTGIDGDNSNLIQIYWLMGRSQDSRNRILVDDGNGRLRTELANSEQKPKDTSLIIYCAMAEDQEEGWYVVSNGRQTESILEALKKSGDHFTSLKKWEYEPDPPNFTPRITSAYSPYKAELFISIIKSLRLAAGPINNFLIMEIWLLDLVFVYLLMRMMGIPCLLLGESHSSFL